MEWEAGANQVNAQRLRGLRPDKGRRLNSDTKADFAAAKEAAAVALDRLGGVGNVRLRGTSGDSIQVEVTRWQ